jgi:hypothetical protein
MHVFTAECNSESCPCQEDQEGAAFVKQDPKSSLAVHVRRGSSH